MKAHIWKAYLPVGRPRIKIDPTDVEFFAARGIDRQRLAGALAVMRLMRQEVLRLLHSGWRVRMRHSYSDKIAKTNVHITEYHILVHDYRGKPHIDATLWFNFRVDARRLLTKKWVGVRSVLPEQISQPAGLDTTKIAEGVVLNAMVEQSRWYVSLLRSHRDEVSDVDVLKHVGQFLHFFANMSQLVIA